MKRLRSGELDEETLEGIFLEGEHCEIHGAQVLAVGLACGRKELLKISLNFMSSGSATSLHSNLSNLTRGLRKGMEGWSLDPNPKLEGPPNSLFVEDANPTDQEMYHSSLPGIGNWPCKAKSPVSLFGLVSYIFLEV